MQPSRHLGRITLMVQLQQPIQDLLSDHRADCVSDALPRLLESMIQLKISPTVGMRNRVIDFPVKIAQLYDVAIHASRIMYEVIDLCEPCLSRRHHFAPVRVKPVTQTSHLMRQFWKRKWLEYI